MHMLNSVFRQIITDNHDHFIADGGDLLGVLEAQSESKAILFFPETDDSNLVLAEHRQAGLEDKIMYSVSKPDWDALKKLPAVLSTVRTQNIQTAPAHLTAVQCLEVRWDNYQPVQEEATAAPSE